MNGWTTVRAASRLHLGLFNVSDATPFRYGGAGFAIAHPCVEVSVRRARFNRVESLVVMDERATRDIEGVLGVLGRRLGGGFRVLVRSLPAQHAGLGTKTALILAVLRGAYNAAGVRATRSLLQQLSGRGGTSGVGIHTFFAGGFVFDSGRMTTPEERFGPSSMHSGAPHDLPVVLIRGRVPDTWKVTLFLASSSRLHGAREVDFFAKHAPIPRQEALLTVAVGYQQLGAAFVQRNHSAVAFALRAMHSFGFKQRELKAQSRATQELVRALQGLHGCAAGLSSIGPTVYALTDTASPSDATPAVLSVARECGAEPFATAYPSNKGYEILP